MSDTGILRNRWWIPFAAALALVAGQGAINVFSAGVFMKPVGDELGFGRGEFSNAIFLSNIMVAVFIPFFGRWVDRKGAKGPLLISIVLFGLATAAMYFLQPLTAVLLGLYGLSGIASVGQCPTAYSKVIAAWFDRQRGLAMGIALAGVGVGTAYIPKLANFLIASFGWRIGYVGLGVTIMILAFIPVLLFIREPIVAAAKPGQAATAQLPGMEFAEAIRTWRYWALAAAFFIASVVINGSLIHIVPLLTDRGIPVGVAVGMMWWAGMALIVGRLIAGWIIDRVYAPYVAVFFIVCPLIGIIILASGTTLVSPLIGVALLGMGIGAEVDLQSFIITRYFGIRSFGALHGLMFSGNVIGNAVGAMSLGWSFQLLHSYNPAFAVFAVLMVVVCVLFLILGPYRYSARGALGVEVAPTPAAA